MCFVHLLITTLLGFLRPQSWFLLSRSLWITGGIREGPKYQSVPLLSCTHQLSRIEKTSGVWAPSVLCQATMALFPASHTLSPSLDTSNWKDFPFSTWTTDLSQGWIYFFFFYYKGYSFVTLKKLNAHFWKTWFSTRSYTLGLPSSGSDR